MSIATAPGWTVAPAGVGAFTCNHCGEYLSKRESNTLASHHFVTCSNCQQTVDLYVAHNLSIDHDSARHIDENNVRNDIWYHATKLENWMDELIEGEAEHRDFGLGYYDNFDPENVTIMVHVGTVDAALDRAGDSLNHEKANFYVYALRLKEGVHIAPQILADENEACPSFVADCNGAYSEHVTRYVNTYESPGSISLLVNRTCIEIIDRITITA